MTYSYYDSYRPTGLQWLGTIPKHWDRAPLWTFYRRVKRTGFATERLLSVYRDYGVVPKDSRDDNFNKPSDDLEAYQLVEAGDLVLNKMKAWQGSVAISSYRGIVSPAYFVYKPVREGHRSYFHYLFRSPQYTAGYLSISKGIRVSQWDIDPDLHRCMPVVLPPLGEQEAISKFLDRETAKIDALVGEQRRLMELLREKRQAVITHAVIKGLNDDARMKPTGIEWLGDVPAHWGLSRTKYATSLIVDCPHETPVYSDEGDKCVIRTADIDRGTLLTHGMLRVDDSEYAARIRRAALLPLDIVYSREGERWGHAALIPTADTFCLGQRMMQLRSSDDWSPHFLMWAMNSASTYVQGDVEIVGATSPHVNVSTVRNFALPCPPLDEQKLISAHIATSAEQYDELIKSAANAITLLTERRAALISAAVTGQIDVRHLVPAEAA